MKTTLLSLAAVTAIALPSAHPLFGSSDSTAAPAARVVHCQVPCGIYGDQMRIDMLMEDAATIEKGMKTLLEFEQEEAPSQNQLVRWVLNKDEHAQNIQHQVASYWLAQRIKLPTADADSAARKKYADQLALLHRITVQAMKCKQTTDLSHVAAIRSTAMDFSTTYFSAEDLEHIRAHHEDGE